MIYFLMSLGYSIAWYFSLQIWTHPFSSPWSIFISVHWNLTSISFHFHAQFCTQNTNLE